MTSNNREQVQEQSEAQEQSTGNVRSRKFNYANVMSTVAVFVALGGTGYAAAKINGSTIKDRTIPGKKLERGAVGTSELGKKAIIARAKLATNADRAKLATDANHAKTADSTSHLLVPTKSTERKVTARAAGDPPAPCNTGSLVELPAGGECEIFRKDPFIVTGKCIDKGDGVLRAEINVNSSVDGWYGGMESGVHNAGTTSLGSLESAGSLTTYTLPRTLQAPGNALQVSGAEIDLRHLADCSISINAIG